MSGRDEPRFRMVTSRYPRRGASPARGLARGALLQRGSPRGASFQRVGLRGSRSRHLRGPPRSPPPSPPPADEDQPTLWEILTQLVRSFRTRKWRELWASVPARERCAVCVNVRAGAWAAAALAAAGGVTGLVLLAMRTARAAAWASVYADRAALLAYLTALAATAALLLLPGAAVLVTGLVLRSRALVEGSLWAMAAHLALDWLATGCMAAYCLLQPACLRAGDAGGATFLVSSSVLMLGYSVLWTHLLLAVNSYRKTF